MYLPAEDSHDSLLLKIDQLQTQLADQKRFANERIAALLEDRRIRDADEVMMKEAAEKRAADLADRLKRTELLLMKATKDHIMQRVSPYILEEQQQLLEIELKKLAGAKEEMKTTIEQSRWRPSRWPRRRQRSTWTSLRISSSADQRSRLSTEAAHRRP